MIRFSTLILSFMAIASVFAAPAAPADLIQSGKNYTLTNVLGGTCIDLSGADNHSIIGYPCHNGTNQKWTFSWIGTAWTLRAVSDGQYLSVDGTPVQNVSLVAASQPFVWDIWKDEIDPTVYRFFAPNTPLNIDLSPHGDPTPGASIILWEKWIGRNQVWNVTEA